MDLGKLLLILTVMLVGMVVQYASATQNTEDRLFTAFRDGRAQVVTYTVPGEGQCKAVLIDGRRQAEKCEGETP